MKLVLGVAKKFEMQLMVGAQDEERVHKKNVLSVVWAQFSFSEHDK